MLSGSISNSKLDNSNFTLTAGSGLSGAGLISLGDTTSLSVNVDDESIEIVSDTLQVKDLGITNDMLSGSITNSKLDNSSFTLTAGDGISGGGLISLGGSSTIDVDSTVIRTTGGQTITGTLEVTGVLTGGSITDGTATLSSGKLSGLVAPTSESDAANKQCVDN